MKVNFITGQIKEKSGLSRYAEEVYNGYKGEKELIKLDFSRKNKLHRLWKQFVSYPTKIKNKQKNCINHITRQDFSFVLNSGKISNSVVTCHDLWALLGKEKKSIIDKIMIKLWAKGMRKAKYIISDSENTKKDIIRLLKLPDNKINVVYLGISPVFKEIKINKTNLRKKYGVPLNTKVILYVGSEGKRKNLHMLVKAFHKLKKSMPNCIFLKVGTSQDDKERARLVSLIKKLKLEKDVLFVGHVTEKELAQFYNLADIFVLPSLYEGFGFPVLEAMACGCPVIASNSSSLPELMADTGIMVDPRDVDSLCKNMRKVLGDNKLRKRMIEKGLKRSKEFTWKRTIEMTNRVYKKMQKISKESSK